MDSTPLRSRVVTPLSPPATPGAPAAAPFIKWAGGKSRLIAQYADHFPTEFGAYYEPFLGGGAVFFHLAPDRAVLSDINPRLIEAYQAVADDPAAVMERLDAHRRRHSEEHYTQSRRRLNEGQTRPLVDRAALFIYLNKTCFNGLYRENRRGDFNVPIGSYTNPTLYERDNLIAVAQRLAGASIQQASFDAVLESAQEGDLVYFDPPYFPASKTASFTNYAAGGFEVDLQVKLAKVFAELARRGCFVMLSNSDVPAMHELYAGWRLVTVSAARCINSSGAKRGPVGELLVKSW